MTKDYILSVMSSENTQLKHNKVINPKPRTSVDPTYDAILKQIHQVIRNLVQAYNIKETYVDKDDPWSQILAAAAFAIFSTKIC